jgi:ATP-dependent Lon protease
MTEQVSNLENKNELNNLNKGYKLYKLERYEDALKEFDSAIAINKENMFGEAYLGKGASLSLIGQRELAEEAYDRAINKLCSGAYYNKGLLLSKAGRIYEAHICYERAIELEPKDSKLYCELGRNLGEFDSSFAKEAINAFDQAIMLKPHYAEAYYEQGVVLKRFKRYEDAIAAYDKAIKLKPDYAQAYNGKGAALYSLARYEDALKEFDRAIALDPHDPVYFCNKGDALYKLERYEEAIKEYDKAIELKPDYAVAYQNKGTALYELKQYAEALKEYDKTIELKPDDALGYFSKGSIYNYLEQYEEAIKYCNKAIELDPKCASAFCHKGYALYGLKKYKEAIIEYNKAIALDPEYKNAIVDKKMVLEAIARQASDKDLEVLLANTPLPSNVRKIAEQKIALLKGSQGSNDGDRSYTEKYLNYLFRLPWGKYDEASIDIIEAEKILNENHYGLEQVKQKIIEALAFMAHSQNAKPPILCLVGAPGVGKTSIAKIISKALNRKSVTLSLAGARDEGLIRGCMDFYMGARPGKALSLLSEVGSSNPVMILDEIDKISQERGTALEGALLQLIDPSQNDSFTDDYFDFGYDMSKVFFIATANSIDNISYPLLHRMEVIDISGYTDNEKVQITQDYIIPKLMKEANVPSNKFTLSDALIRHIIENYTRESGVRDVERKIRELLQKYLLAEARKEQITLTKETIDKYFKHSKYHKQKLQDDEVTIGMINGLAHTARGGDLIKIEASKYRGDGKIKATGKLGEVLKESIDAAMTCLKSSIDSKTKEISDDILKTHDIHIHLPAGATPKDGPSAGITIYTALYSLLSNKKLRQDIAMTGEITLKGRVLEIGGLKEKLTAAVREGIKEVIIPKDNERDLAEIPEEIKKALVIHTVSNTSEILGIVFKTQMSNKNTKQKTQKENMGKVLQFPKQKKDKKN